MKVDELLDAIGNIDESVIEESEHYKKQSRPFLTRHIGTLAACLCLTIIVGSFLILLTPGMDSQKSPEVSYESQEENADREDGAVTGVGKNETETGMGEKETSSSNSLSFTFEGINYTPLKDEDVTIAEEEIGKKLGVVSDSMDDSISGCEIYEYKDHDDQLLVKKDSAYYIYEKTD